MSRLYILLHMALCVCVIADSGASKASFILAILSALTIIYFVVKVYERVNNYTEQTKRSEEPEK